MSLPPDEARRKQAGPTTAAATTAAAASNSSNTTAGHTHATRHGLHEPAGSGPPGHLPERPDYFPRTHAGREPASNNVQPSHPFSATAAHHAASDHTPAAAAGHVDQHAADQHAAGHHADEAASVSPIPTSTGEDPDFPQPRPAFAHRLDEPVGLPADELLRHAHPQRQHDHVEPEG